MRSEFCANMFKERKHYFVRAHVNIVKPDDSNDYRILLFVLAVGSATEYRGVLSQSLR